MDNSYSENIKVCATCNFWMGNRHLNSTRTIVKCATGSDGDCLEGGLKKTHKMNSASCSNWERWSTIRQSNFTSKNNTAGNKKKSTNNGNQKKGVIPYPIAVGLILLVALINFAVKNIAYVIGTGIVLLVCFVTCFIIYKKIQKPKFKIILTILVGVIFTIIVNTSIYRHKSKIIEMNRQATMQILSTIQKSTVLNGYKPCFGSGNTHPSDEYNKIVVNGRLSYSAYENYFYIDVTGSTSNPQLDTNSVNTYYKKTTNQNAPRSSSIDLWGLFLITKTGTESLRYVLDDVIQYNYSGNPETDLRGLIQEIITYQNITYSFRDRENGLPILDTWILNNAD